MKPMMVVGLTLYASTQEQIDRIAALRAECAYPMIAFDNGGVSPGNIARLQEGGVTVLATGANLGVAAALNAIAEAAIAAGASDLLLLDQDTRIGATAIADLVAARDRLRSLVQPMAVVGPSPGSAGPDAKAPRYRRRSNLLPFGSLVPVEFLATSGSLIDLAAFREIGPFRADYFIDGIDLEWCFRAWAAGYGCWMAQDIAIGHRVGVGTIRARGIAMPRQPLFRMATYLRNSVYGWRLGHIPAQWKLRQTLYLPVQTALYWRDAGYRPAVLVRLAGAVRDGLMGRLGRPYDAP